ncbi:hypothetical protein T479_01095 [Lysinibacillus varians]|nr:hypothetical protein T479_01095 [Lysinibacillus varians]
MFDEKRNKTREMKQASNFCSISLVLSMKWLAISLA